ncbi:hypothetical protein G6F57_009515 [Rhizopus arrhizus]|nr:hypothetical protein G6F30_005188 [Rhizopus arrhizus]KAG1414999.1 hypothetical protein G6F58_006686 [Rhizopus delemar]KAG0984209.1 hypothetical protein G6F29_004934 [Rhizopus arrhizus]KAG0986980.1 hypothetical protein G6F28_010117 [Rhizopus arrhizus]KAG1003996.1 hypothetical protein G6F27_010546 [Rhizopus arrhizus]
MNDLSPPPRIIGRVRAIYSYYSEEKSSLSFRKGDVINVLAKLESGWWDGWCNGERGWFPSNYVEVISEDTYSRPPESALPPKPLDRVSSIYSNSTSSETSQSNNSNLPDGWTIQMTDDGRQWYYYNELSGKITYQNPALLDQEDKKDQKITDYNRDSFFHPSLSIEEEKERVEQEMDDEPSATAPTLEELMKNWVERKTPQGRIYFCNLITQETTWDYDEIDVGTGYLKKTEKEVETDEEDEEKKVKEDEQSHSGSAVQEQVTKKLTWTKVAADIAFNIHELINAAQKGQRDQLPLKTTLTVESIRLMLYASRALDKDSPLVTEPVFRDPRRSVMSSLSKLVLDSKLGAEPSNDSNPENMLERVQKDANDVLIGVRNFVTACQQRNVPIYSIDLQLFADSSQLPFDPYLLESPGILKTNNPKINPTKNVTTGMINLGLTPEDRKKMNKVTREISSSLLQKGKYLLNGDLILSLQVYSHQIYTSAEELSVAAHALVSQNDNDDDKTDKRASSIALFRTLSTQVGQYIAILDDINLDSIDNSQIPSITTYYSSRKSIYSALAHLFGTVQTLTNPDINIHDSVQTLDQAVIHIENVIETVEQSVIAMVNERKRNMNVNREEVLLSPSATTPRRNSFCDSENGIQTSSLEEESEVEFGEFDVDDTRSMHSNLRRPTLAASGISDIVNRRRQQSIRPDDRSVDSMDTLGSDHHPDELELASDGSIKGGTLPALVERLTVHDTLDTNFIATFLLTYRSFCTTEEVVSLLEARYNLRPPERLTPEQLEMWTERKQKLVRLRIFNVLKNWLENYYIDEDEHLLGRFEYFTNSYVRDSSEFAANQILALIKKRAESRGEMKKIVPNPINGPDPIFPKNIQNITLFETDPLEMARQLSIKDFKLYSSIRPIECLGKAWSRDGVHGSIAVNIKQSIQYCNRLTSWVTESILFYEEAKKRAGVIKYWVQVADHCRTVNNYNTCMAILSAFDNSSIGRLKKTWMLCSRSTTQSLASIRKLLGANRNFVEYREIIHSVNPPCIPFLGIYLQDLTFIEDGNSDYLRKSNSLINFAKQQKVAEVIQELKQFQSFAYNFHTIQEFQEFIKTQLDQEHDVEKLYKRSLQLEPRMTETPNSIYVAGNSM